MIQYHCDGCGREIPRKALRYVVSVEVKAAYEEMEVGLMDLVRDHRAEMIALIERMKHSPPREIEESVYKRSAFDLCPACARAFNASPLNFRSQSDAIPEPFDVDGFLRSLGYGESS